MISARLEQRVAGLFALAIAAIAVLPVSVSGAVSPADGLFPTIPRTPTAVVTVQTDSPIALAPGFAGYNVALMYSGVDYRDHHLSDMARSLSIGWLRYPAGTGSDSFDWTTGLMQQAWVCQFQHTDQYDKLETALHALSGKGGDHFLDAAAFSNDVGAAGLIVCVNGFTDTPASAASFAAYARAHGIRVLAWELSNEPYFFSGFFAGATEYANQMMPFAQAIKTADPAAKIALFASDAGNEKAKWDDSLAAFAPRYWDLITYHHYTSTVSNVTDIPTLMGLLNDVLVNGTSSYITNQIVPRFGAMPVIITEFDPSNGSLTSGLSSTLYGGVWAAEYALRMSSTGQVQRVGVHQLVNPSGIDLTNNHLTDVLEADSVGKTIDTSHLDFGYFKSAQAVAYGVACSAINSASRVYTTSVAGGGAVPIASGGTTPALYAQAYERSGAREHALYEGPFDRSHWTDLVVTNKGEAPEVISISMNGQAVSSLLLVTAATGAAGAADMNTYEQADVAARSSFAISTVLVPAYSVVRVSWREFNSPIAAQQIVAAPGGGSSGFWLGRAAPNPAVGGSVLRYSLATAGPAELSVFDARGALVRRLVRGSQAAGEAQVTWDGRNDRGAEVAGGMYFLRLTAAGVGPLTQRLVWIR